MNDAIDQPPAKPRESLHPLGRKSVTIIQKRSEFLLCAKAARWGTAGMVVQGRKRREDEPSLSPVRVGYTCSKKVGNAVARNRAKRRLRAAAHEVMYKLAQPGWDYVLIGKHEITDQRPFTDLCKDLERSLAKLHAGKAITGNDRPRKKSKNGKPKGPRKSHRKPTTKPEGQGQ